MTNRSQMSITRNATQQTMQVCLMAAAQVTVSRDDRYWPGAVFRTADPINRAVPRDTLYLYLRSWVSRQ